MFKDMNLVNKAVHEQNPWNSGQFGGKGFNHSNCSSTVQTNVSKENVTTE